MRSCGPFPSEEPDLSTFAEIKSKELLLKYLQNTPSDSDPAPTTEKEFIHQIAAFMGTHLDYPLTIKLLFRTFSINETTLKRRFKQYIYSDERDQAFRFIEIYSQKLVISCSMIINFA